MKIECKDTGEEHTKLQRQKKVSGHILRKMIRHCDFECSQTTLSIDSTKKHSHKQKTGTSERCKTNNSVESSGEHTQDKKTAILTFYDYR